MDETGQRIGSVDFISLCYRRPRRLPDWPYNLFSMIHGQDRDAVLRNIECLIERCGLEDIQYEVLFSRRRFKQRGARYIATGQDENGADNAALQKRIMP